jgi:putative addiction module killer protein
MDPVEKQIWIYQRADGSLPYQEWLDSLRDYRAKQKVQVRIDRVQAGNFGDARSVGAGVMELRINYGPGYRVYFARDGNTVVLLLCGGDKSTQDEDIQTSKTFWEDFQQRKAPPGS